jgi:preprotein translocase subunit SecE
MARNRQRSKQRQAERRARRLQQQAGSGPAQQGGDGGGIPGVDAPRVEPVDTPEPPVDTPEPPGGPGVDPELAVGAPPEEEGRSDFTLEQDQDELEALEDWEVDEALDEEEDQAAVQGEGEAGYAVRGRRGREAAEAHKDRSRVVQFLVAVWAELQRVQWPNRQALVTLTGVVLGFVLIAGGYLGLLDAIFSRIIQAIL